MIISYFCDKINPFPIDCMKIMQKGISSQAYFFPSDLFEFSGPDAEFPEFCTQLQRIPETKRS